MIYVSDSLTAIQHKTAKLKIDFDGSAIEIGESIKRGDAMYRTSFGAYLSYILDTLDDIDVYREIAETKEKYKIKNTCAAIAQYMGISDRTLRNWRANKSRPKDLVQCTKLCLLLRLSYCTSANLIALAHYDLWKNDPKTNVCRWLLDHCAGMPMATCQHVLEKMQADDVVSLM